MAGIEFINKVIHEFQLNKTTTINKYSFKTVFYPVDSSHWSSYHQFLGELICNHSMGLDPRQIELKVRKIMQEIEKKEFTEFKLFSTSKKNINAFTTKKKIKTEKDFKDFMDQPLVGPWAK